jgi:tryptophan-rich sensory protein
MENKPVKYEGDKWYKNQKKSSLTPPGYVFGIAWSILYVILGIYFVLAINVPGSQKAITYFVIQMLFNISWTYVFFKRKLQVTAFVMILIMIFFSILSMMEMFKLNKMVSLVLIPYIAWLCFASYLNGYIIIKN